MTSSRVRIVCVIALLLLAAAAANAESKLSFGAKAGMSMAKQNWDYSDILSFDNDLKLGLAGGVFAEYGIVPRLAIRGEALFVQKGLKATLMLGSEAGPTDELADYKYRLDYLSLNLLVKGQAPFGTYLLAGPRLDIRVANGSDLTDPLMDSIQTEYHSNIFGLTFGLGHEFKTGSRAVIFLEGQYYLDLGKVVEREDFGPDFDGTLESVENQSFAVFAGVRF